MDIQQQVDELLKAKGVTPPHMTDREYSEKFFRKFEAALPDVMEEAVRKIAREIADEEFARVGRREVCRHALNKSEKHCAKPADCFSCPNYKPLPRWQRWLAKPGNAELFFIGLAIPSFILALAFPPIRAGTVGFWFGVVLVSQINAYMLKKSLKKKGLSLAKKS